MHTEDEAKTKACPMSRNSPVSHFNCIGSACMAWVWRVGPPTGLDRAEYNETSDKAKWRGYCGLVRQS